MRWSLSRLGTFEKCQLKYKLKYIDKLEEQQNVYASRGSVTHSVIEEFLKDKTIKDLPQHLRMYESFLDGIRSGDGISEPEVVLALDEKWEPILPDSPDRAWTGVLDLLYRQPKENRATLYDWKTGKIYPDHDDQKDIYGIAVLLHYPELQEVRAVHVYLDLGKNREKTIHRDQVQGMRASWDNRVAKMATATQFIPNPSFLCRYCSFSAANKGPCRF